MDSHEILMELETIPYRYESLMSLIGILQQFVTGQVEFIGEPEDSFTDALYEIKVAMEKNNNRLTRDYLTEKRCSKRTRYPNLLELHDYHPYRERAMCDHAGIESELLRAVLYEGEPLDIAESRGLARLYECPVGVILHHETIMLNMGRRRHIAMAANVCVLYIQLQHMSQDGNQDAGKYLGYAERRFMRFLEAVRYDRLSYCHYLGEREELSQYVSFATLKPKRRGLLRERVM